MVCTFETSMCTTKRRAIKSSKLRNICNEALGMMITVESKRFGICRSLFNALSRRVVAKESRLWFAFIGNRMEQQRGEQCRGNTHALYKHFFTISLTVQLNGMKGNVGYKVRHFVHFEYPISVTLNNMVKRLLRCFSGNLDEDKEKTLTLSLSLSRGN